MRVSGAQSLFPNRLRRAQTVEALDRVPVPNAADVRFANVDHEKGWIVKAETDAGPNAMLAEALGYLIGRRLHVPIPDAAIFGSGTSAAWLSRAVPFCTHWNPAHAMRVENLDGLGRMMALDVIILNSDRHPRNILLGTESDPLHLHAWAIDAGTAAIGWPDDYLQAANEVPSPERIAPGLPIEMMRDGAVAAAIEATSITNREIFDFVMESMTFVEDTDRQRHVALCRTLRRRCDLAPDMVPRYLDVVGEVR